MKWFKKWLFRMTREGSSLMQYDDQSKEATNTIGVVRADRFQQHGMNFTIYKANGGYVMEYRSYDQKTDRSDNRLHIITPDQDLGQQIAHIITYEALQQ